MAAPPANGHEDDGHVGESEDAVGGGDDGATIRLFDEIADEQIGDVHEPEDEGGGEARVPGPPDSPDGARPDGAGNKHDGGEGETGFGGSDLTPAMLRLAEDREVSVAIVLTDGELDYPQEPVPYSVLWVLPAWKNPPEFTPRYGKVIAMTRA